MIKNCFVNKKEVKTNTVSIKLRNFSCSVN
jgi:hypothetical protein